MDWYCSKTATKVLNVLTFGLNESNRARKFDNAPGSFMPVSVEYLYQDEVNGGSIFSIAHYFEQNGDLMRDPEMVFICAYIIIPAHNNFETFDDYEIASDEELKKGLHLWVNAFTDFVKGCRDKNIKNIIAALLKISIYLNKDGALWSFFHWEEELSDFKNVEYIIGVDYDVLTLSIANDRPDFFELFSVMNKKGKKEKIYKKIILSPYELIKKTFGGLKNISPDRFDMTDNPFHQIIHQRLSTTNERRVLSKASNLLNEKSFLKIVESPDDIPPSEMQLASTKTCLCGCGRKFQTDRKNRIYFESKCGNKIRQKKYQLNKDVKYLKSHKNPKITGYSSE